MRAVGVTLVVSFASLCCAKDCIVSLALRIARSEWSICWLCIEMEGSDMQVGQVRIKSMGVYVIKCHNAEFRQDNAGF